jgi:hypothetical protein
MDYQGEGYRTDPRHALGNPSDPRRAYGTSGATPALGRNPMRGYPPARPPQPDGFAPGTNGYQDGDDLGNAYSPVSGYRPEDWTDAEDGPSRDGWDDGGHGGRSAGRRDVRKGGPPARKGGPRRRLAAGVVALAVVVLGGGGYLGYQQFGRSSHTINPGSSLRLPTSDPTAESTYFSPKLGHWQHITTRKLDPAPVTAAELYPPGFTLFGTKSGYQRVATSTDSTCGLAVFGALLQASLQSGDCKQVVRATYLSSDSTMMGTIGVINLSTATAAQQSAEVSDSDNLIAPLNASKGPAKKMLNGTGVEYAEVKGHYLILMYAEFTNLKPPTAQAARQRLVTFAEGMFSGSANIALSHRLLTGKPQA